MKIVEIAASPIPARADLFKEMVQKYAGLAIEFDCVQVGLDDFEQTLEELKKTADVIKVGTAFAENILSILTNFTTEIQTIGACDILEKQNDMWWPRNYLNRAFYKTLSNDIDKVNLKYNAFIVGAGAACKSAFAALVRAGFTKVTITDKFSEKGMLTLAEIKKKFFGIDVEFVPMQAVTTLPGVHSLVVNTTPLVLENDLLDELYFFNFLHEGGIVIDLQLVPPHTPLLREAETWGARSLSGEFVAAHFDTLLIEHLTKVHVPVDEYRKELRGRLDSVPFDIEPFLKRLRER